MHHAPQLTGMGNAATQAQIALEEGVRMVCEVLSGREQVAIGAPVHVVLEKIDDDLTLAQWAVDDEGSAG